MNNHLDINKTMTDNIIFEYPLREQVRSFLRLESLFLQFERNRIAIHQDNHLHALKILFEILEILERGDTRSELTKELARLSESFIRLKEYPDVDLNKLDNFLKQVKQLHLWVVNHQGKFGDRLRKNPFLDNLKHRMSIPGGASSFDCPDLFLFLNKTFQTRQQLLAKWFEDIKGIKTSIDVILRIMRDTGNWQINTAPLGSFIVENSEQSLQLLRIKMLDNEGIFPEFSCGKHRSNIHFMRHDENHKKIPQQREIKFELAVCH